MADLLIKPLLVFPPWIASHLIAIMLRLSFTLLLSAAVLLLSVPATFGVDAAQREKIFQEKAQPLLKKYCFGCHAGEKPEADLNLEKFSSVELILANRPTWAKVFSQLQVGAMPPSEEGIARPTEGEARGLNRWLDDLLNNIDCNGVVSPGHVTLRRLNRSEYRNTIRDLLAVDYQQTADFPSDDVGYGFDNIGDVLSLPPILMEKYLAAAEEITSKAIVTEIPGAPIRKRIKATEFSGDGETNNSRLRGLSSTGEMFAEFDLPSAGQYELLAMAAGDQAGSEPVKMAFRMDGKDLKIVDVKAPRSKPTMYRITAQGNAGKHRIGLAFTNDFYNPTSKDPKDRDRNMVVEYLEVRGPVGDKPPVLPESHKRIFFLQPDDENTPNEAAEKILKRFASRAFRRPATDQEAARLTKLVEYAQDQGETFEGGVALAIQAVLVSPHFLFRVEQDPPNNDPQAVRELNDYEIASRLSYFLWSSMPDDELFRLSWEGKLREGDNLKRQVGRMLADSKSQAIIDNFAAQWLQLRLLDGIIVDRQRFPSYDDELRAAMKTESMKFFGAVLQENRSIIDLLQADFTFVNERLARHYGIPNVKGNEFQRVSLAGTNRAGVLTQASVLTITSNPTRTSPVKRGRWVLENMLNEPPPPPPANVPELDDAKRELKGSLRQRMEQHRKNPACASCHQQMDALGFALENFNAVGEWRTSDGSDPIDPSGVLPGGEKFNGSTELISVLAKAKRQQFLRCFTEKLLTYGLGRGLEYYDKCAVDKILAAAAKEDYRFAHVVLEIARSEPFQKRAAKPQP